MNNSSIKKFYNELGGEYSKGWVNPGMKVISNFEETFVRKTLEGVVEEMHPNKVCVLDIGVGSGRISKNLISFDSVSYYGVDIADTMVSVVKESLTGYPGFREVKTNDISKGIEYEADKFDFISCIRVLKYNSNWKWILGDIYRVLSKDGTLVFTLPNRCSLNYFSRGKLPMHGTTIKGIRSVLKDLGFRDVHIERGFKMPDIMYYVTSNEKLLRLYVVLEEVLYRLLGPAFSRGLYITCRK